MPTTAALRFALAATLLVGASIAQAGLLLPAVQKIEDSDGNLASNGTASSSLVGTTLDLNIEWQGTPITGSFDFEATSLFDLALLAYTPTSGFSQNDVSGYILDLLDTAGNSISRLTTDTPFCRDPQGNGSPGAGPSITDGGDRCNLVTGTASTYSANPAAKPGEVLFSGLAAGTYRLGFYDSSTPQGGSVTFRATAVPAPGTVLLGLLALIPLLQRRRA